jgi:hypothetical protein
LHAKHAFSTFHRDNRHRKLALLGVDPHGPAAAAADLARGRCDRLEPGIDALKAHFVGAFQALPRATVKFGDQLIRVYGDTAVNTGYYTFSYTKDGSACRSR